jgi:hypothetical protein
MPRPLVRSGARSASVGSRCDAAPVPSSRKCRLDVFHTGTSSGMIVREKVIDTRPGLAVLLAWRLTAAATDEDAIKAGVAGAGLGSRRSLACWLLVFQASGARTLLRFARTVARFDGIRFRATRVRRPLRIQGLCRELGPLDAAKLPRAECVYRLPLCTQHNPRSEQLASLDSWRRKGQRACVPSEFYKDRECPGRDTPLPTQPEVMSRQNMIPAAEIESLVLQGASIVIHEGHALDLGEWINRHPGGKLAILHMVGRDATDEINM